MKPYAKLLTCLGLGFCLWVSATPSHAFFPWLIRFLGRTATVEEAAATRAAIANGERRAVSKAAKPDVGWMEREAGKQVIKKVVDAAFDGATRPQGQSPQISDCLVTVFDGRVNTISNNCGVAVQVEQGWLQIQNKEDVAEYFRWVIFKVQGRWPERRPDDKIDDVASWTCSDNCSIEPYGSLEVQPPLIRAPRDVSLDNRAVDTGAVNLSGRAVELMGPMIAIKYRNI